MSLVLERATILMWGGSTLPSSCDGNAGYFPLRVAKRCVNPVKN